MSRSERPADRFPRQNARTRRYTLGRPRDFAVAADGSRVVYLRSLHGEDPVHRLWELTVESAAERVLADPADLLAGGPDDLPPEERARRERMRESGEGIVAFAGDRDLTVIAFALAGRLFVADLRGAQPRVRELPASGPVFDPRPDPTGRFVAWVADGRLRVLDLEDDSERVVSPQEPSESVRWGLAEFIAAEEMGRARGFWWAPDGSRLATARVDEAPVLRWHIANPVDPAEAPVAVSYPAAGTPNAVVGLWILDRCGDQAPREVRWDREAHPYLARVRWDPDTPLTLLVQSRDQREALVLTADPETGDTRTRSRLHDAAWVELVDGVPAWLPDGRLVTTLDRGEVRSLAVDGRAVGPDDLHVRRVLHADGAGVLVAATTDPLDIHIVRIAPGSGEAEWLTSGQGVHGAVASGATVVITGSDMDHHEPRIGIHRDGREVATIASHAQRPVLEPRVRLLELGPRRLRAALLLPTDPPEGPLPVLLDPYGGPGAQRVVRASGAYLVSQWFAEQGLAVLVIDGRGTPGRGPRWEREIHRDFAGPTLDDQVEGLRAAGEEEPRLDLSRVGIRGWSFGGYLAALAVLRRPDVFHVGVAGAPVTEWSLYDTHYTERYLGDPREEPEVYARSSLVADAQRLERPLLLIHGLADDNVVVAHSLRLSRALVEAGRPHTFLPLSGVTHMTPQEVVAENLLRLQLKFLQDAFRRR